MNNSEILDLCCFSYLAKTELLIVDHYPVANDGAEILQKGTTVAADGAMISVIVARFGMSSGLISNPPGRDSEDGLFKLLELSKVKLSWADSTATIPPITYVICDKNETRTWFSHIPGFAELLEKTSLDMMRQSRLGYIDFYPIIETASLKAIEYAHQVQTPVYLNLGSTRINARLKKLLENKGIILVQVSVEDSSPEDPEKVAKDILENIRPMAVIVTQGRGGAFYFSEQEKHYLPAYEVDVIYTHCAGAAFSAGYIYGYNHKWKPVEAMRFACALAAMHCTVT